MTVTCVNDAPVADDDTFAGNTARDRQHRPRRRRPRPTRRRSLAEPKSVVTGDILAGDTDVDGGPLTIVAGTFATNDGGSVTIEADGDFVFHPKASANCADTSDSFDYTVDDYGRRPPTPARVTIELVGCVWYVDNTAAAGGTAPRPTRSTPSPRPRRPPAPTTPSSCSRATAPRTGYDTGFQMDAGERLIGEAAGLTVDPDGPGRTGPASLYPATAGARPLLTASNEDVVVARTTATRCAACSSTRAAPAAASPARRATPAAGPSPTSGSSTPAPRAPSRASS